MPKHPDFIKIYKRFIAQYGKEEGESFYHAWLKEKGYDDTKPFPGKKKKGEKKELMCKIRGFEIKETPTEYHIQGLIATSHIDDLDKYEGIDMPDIAPKETLESWANQVNTIEAARVMGIHHSEGRTINPEFFGKADVNNAPAKVIQLNDGEWGCWVDSKLLKHDPKTPEIINQIETGELNSFSITFDTDGFKTTDFGWVGDKFVRILGPETRLHGYTLADNPVNPHAVAMGHGFKEFKELVGKGEKNSEEVGIMPEDDIKKGEPGKENPEEEAGSESEEAEEEEPSKGEPVEGESEKMDDAEKKEFLKYKKEKKVLEAKELLEATAEKVAEKLLQKFELKEKVPLDNNQSGDDNKSFELKEFNLLMTKDGRSVELKEQFRRAGALCDMIPTLDWETARTKPAEKREYKNFGVNGTRLEYKGLGITTNQNTDTDYLQSSAELNDVYDPLIYNALNQETVTWNLLAKDDYSKKGNNMIQFKLKITANTSATFYTGNSVATGNVGRLKYQTKFKKMQVGVSVDGDMIAAARGGPVGDVFAQEVMDSTMDLLAVLNLALFAEVGLETAAGPIGFEYITDSASNTELYSLTRSTTNKLAPDSAGDTYINQSSTIISMSNLRKAKRQAIVEGARKRNMVFITDPTQGDLLRGKFDDSRRMLTTRDTGFGFSTDLFVDGIPVFEDKDCQDDDWWCVDLETHRVGIWIPPTLERLGKTADSEDAFVKSYLGTYNRAPRRLVQIYGCATS